MFPAKPASGVWLEFSAESLAAADGSIVQADAALPLFGLGPHNLAVHDDVHVVFPLVVSATLAHVHSTHGRLARKFGRFIHVVSAP